MPNGSLDIEAHYPGRGHRGLESLLSHNRDIANIGIIYCGGPVVFFQKCHHPVSDWIYQALTLDMMDSTEFPILPSASI